MRFPRYMKVKWSHTPTTMDQKGAGGVYLQEITVRWWGWPIVVWRAWGKYTITIKIFRRWSFKVPRILTYPYIFYRIRQKPSGGNFIIGG